MATLETNLVQPSTGTTLTLGASGDTVALGTGASSSGFGDNTPSFSAYASGSQSVSGGTWTKLVFGAEDYDTDSAFDHSTNYRFTVPSSEAGKYLMIASAAFAAPSDTTRYAEIRFYKNGSAFGARSVTTPNNDPGAMCITQIMDLSVSDYIEVWCYTELNSPGASTVQADDTRFSSMKLIGV